MVKLLCSETAQHIINQAIQLFGGYGFMMEYPIQRFRRDARVLTVTEGVPEIHRGIIFRSLNAGSPAAEGIPPKTERIRKEWKAQRRNPLRHDPKRSPLPSAARGA